MKVIASLAAIGLLACSLSAAYAQPAKCATKSAKAPQFGVVCVSPGAKCLVDDVPGNVGRCTNLSGDSCECKSFKRSQKKS